MNLESIDTCSITHAYIHEGYHRQRSMYLDLIWIELELIIKNEHSISCALSLHKLGHPWLWSTHTKRHQYCYYCKLIPEYIDHNATDYFVVFFFDLMPSYIFKANFSFKKRTLPNKTMKHHVIYGPVNNAKKHQILLLEEKKNWKINIWFWVCLFVTQDFLSKNRRIWYFDVVFEKEWKYSPR